MRIIILVFSVLLTVSNIHAQRIQHLKKGNAFYKEKDYTNAVVEYEKLWNSTAGAKLLGVDAKMNLANSYRLMDYPFKAKELYQQVMQYGDDRQSIYLEYGKVLMSLGRYDEAIKQFEIYAQKNPESTEPAALIQQCKDIENIEPLFTNVDILNQDLVNDTATRQIGITYYGDGVVFASDELGEDLGDMRTRGFLNMRVSGVNAEGNLKRSEKFTQSLNSNERHDGPAAFSRDGLHVFYSQSVPTRDGGTVLQIWTSSFRDGRWTEARPLEFLMQGSNFTHPTLSADGRTLYFASDMKGTFGGLDIWMSNYEDNSWTYPINLGKDINTEKDDAWPYIHPDGDLYFSSKGHPGFGGYDIFRTRPLGNGVDWLPIENLGQPFNSSFSDVSFIMSDDQTQGFLSSNRAKSYDIFKFVLVGAEKQILPEGIPPRTSIGISEIEHPVILSDIPKRPDGMTDDEYIAFLADKANKGEIDLPKADEPKNTPLPDDKSDPTNTEPTPTNNPSSTGNPTNNPPVNTEPTPTPSEDIVLAVVLKVMDVANSRPLSDAKVVVKNKFTQEETVLDVNAQGEIEVRLEPDQKYTISGQCMGYKESSLPVSTMGVVASDRVQANLPMEKE
ncbi:tetratricopeptide repeat protein [Aureispira sp. CCB-QB1]|uniref:tetratricopeptide repeat protein n=1 Tax=Aureispira sp. CCB-QB1 TaxID=1313421 RepID=UPI0006980039|nr:tetratricopeptide repeat protein [Aureispira sp. CCB-QB1]